MADLSREEIRERIRQLEEKYAEINKAYMTTYAEFTAEMERDGPRDHVALEAARVNTIIAFEEMLDTAIICNGYQRQLRGKL